MASIDHIVEDLKSLPPQKQEVAADFIRRLKATGEGSSPLSLSRTSGSLTEGEASELERIIEEGCEMVDEREW